MNAEQFLFWFFALLTCGGAITVVVTQNIVRMAFWLIISLGSVAALFFLAGADFVGAAQLMIYVGGTIVLLIFGVMLTATGPQSIVKTSPAELLLAGGVGSLFLTMLIATVVSVDWSENRLKLIDITESKFNEVRDLEDKSGHEATLHLLDSHYKFDDFRLVYRLRVEKKLAPKEVELLTQLWQKNGLKFSPGDANGGTTRPLGLSFLGIRPDRDLINRQYQADNTSQRVSIGQRISPGFVMSSRKTAVGSSSGELSTGYLLPFEIVSIHLLVVLIGAAYLARAKKRVPESN